MSILSTGHPTLQKGLPRPLRVWRNQSAPGLPESRSIDEERSPSLSKHSLLAAHLLLGIWSSPFSPLPPPCCTLPRHSLPTWGGGHSHTAGVAQPGPGSSGHLGATLTCTFHPIVPAVPLCHANQREETSGCLVKTRAEGAERQVPGLARPLPCCVRVARHLQLSVPVCLPWWQSEDTVAACFPSPLPHGDGIADKV